MLDTPQPIDRPSPALAGPGMAAAARRAFLATRPPFLIASVMPVLIGTAWASAAFHRFNGLLFALALAATVLAHAAANVYNDVGDDLIGADAGNTDRIYPYTGGSRFIQTGLLSRAPDDSPRGRLGGCRADSRSAARGVARPRRDSVRVCGPRARASLFAARAHSFLRAASAKRRWRLELRRTAGAWVPYGCRPDASIPARY